MFYEGIRTADPTISSVEATSFVQELFFTEKPLALTIDFIKDLHQGATRGAHRLTIMQLIEIFKVRIKVLSYTTCSGKNSITSPLIKLFLNILWICGLTQQNCLVLRGKTDKELWGEQANYLVLNDKKVVTTGETVRVEEKIKTATGEWMYFTGVKMPLKNENNQIIGLIGNSLDITESKKTQAELKRSMELEAANHDIRTPLTGIVGFSEIIKSEATEPSLKEYADNLVASSHALLHLMDEVLEAIHVSSGEIPRVKRKFNLSNTLKHIIALNKAKAISKRLDLSLHIDEAIPKFLVGDNVRIHRIMLELVANALNFTDVDFVISNHTACQTRR